MSVVNFDGGGWWSKPSCVPPWALRGRVGHPPSPLARSEGGRFLAALGMT